MTRVWLSHLKIGSFQPILAHLPKHEGVTMLHHPALYIGDV